MDALGNRSEAIKKLQACYLVIKIQLQEQPCSKETMKGIGSFWQKPTSNLAKMPIVLWQYVKHALKRWEFIS